MIDTRYKIISQIGKGSFSSVYKAKDLETSHKVALKISSKHFKPFHKAEVELLAALSGQKGFPKLVSHGQKEDKLYIAMSLLGKSLSKRLQREKFSIFEICEIGIKLIKSLQKLHDQFFIHRDIKPENILSGSKNQDHLYLVDFGLAKKYYEKNSNFHIPLKSSTQFKGNLIFCSNNVLSGIEPSRRDDLNSLCLVLILLNRDSLPWVHGWQSATEMIGVRSSVSKQELLNGVATEISELYNYTLSLSFYQKPDYFYMIKLLMRCKKYYLLDRTELVNYRKRRFRGKSERLSIRKSRTEYNRGGVYDSENPTVEIDAPDFSEELRKKIKMMKGKEAKCK